MTRAATYSEDELREQWAFLDALVDRQAASLRSGTQDPEELDVAAAAPEYDGLLRELDSLRERVASLERERDELRRLLHASERRAEPARQPNEERRPWWRRLSG